MSITLFTAITLPDFVADRLIALQKGVPGAKWRPRENLHLTLRYFGEVAEPVAEEIDAGLSALADRARPFEMQLKAAGAFGGGDPHTLWIGVAQNEALNKVAADCERVARRAGLKPEPRKFTPHVTLAYLTGTELGRVQAFETRLGLFQAPPLRVEGFTLFSSWTRKSAPNLYRSEADYPFRA